MTSSQQEPFHSHSAEIVVPDLGTGTAPIQLVHWLVPPGAQLITGERVAELLADSVLFHLESEHDGTLQRLIVGSGSKVVTGQAIAEVLLSERDSSD